MPFTWIFIPYVIGYTWIYHTISDRGCPHYVGDHALQLVEDILRQSNSAYKPRKLTPRLICSAWRCFGNLWFVANKSQQSRNKIALCFTVAMYLGQEPWLLGPKIHKNQVPWLGTLEHPPRATRSSSSGWSLVAQRRSSGWWAPGVFQADSKILLFHKPNSIEYTLDVSRCLLLDIPYDWAYHILIYSIDIFVSLGVFH